MTDHAASTGPLTGLRIVAMEHMAAMPFATQLLGRLGADVIKIEPPGTGDSGRGATPQAHDAAGQPLGATFTRSNGLKRSVVINAKHPAGRELIYRLLGGADVFAENFPPATLPRLGLGPTEVLARHPRLIYASISGFGHTDGPYRDRSAYAAVVEAMSGIYDWKSRPGIPPRANPVGALGDISAGLFAAVGILSALRERDRTGKGQHVDVAMFDAALAMTDVVTNFASLGVPNEAAFGTGIVETFAAADGYFVLQVVREHHFAELANTIGHEEWLTDDRLAARTGWVEHLDAVIRPGIEGWAKSFTRAEVCATLTARGLAAGPCLSSGEVIADPGVAARGSLIEMTTSASTGERDRRAALAPGVAFKLDTWCEPTHQRLPSLGEHTAAVLAPYLSPTDIEALQADGAVQLGNESGNV